MTTSLPAPGTAPRPHILRPDSTNCPGCAMSVGLQWLNEALGAATPTLVIPACCAAVTPGAFPASAYSVPAIETTFASAAAVATGIARVRTAERGGRPHDLLGRRRRHLRHRPGDALRRRRARRGRPLHLLRQRDLRQHRRAAQRRHAARRQDDHDPARQGRGQEGHHGDHGRASCALRGHAVARPP